jgi:hypothetical protein
MTLVGKLIATGLLAWFGALALLVTVRLLRGDIFASGMLTTDKAGDNAVDPERVVAMAVVPAVLAAYIIHALNTGVVTTPAGLYSMPDLSENLVTLLTGGNGLYLAGKIARRG